MESEKGLSQKVAEERLKQFGKNEIQREKGRPIWLLFVGQFQSPLVIILIFACILSAFLGELLEALAIGAILIINAIIGFFQEYRAETAIEALREMTTPRARVLRDGRQVVIPAHDVVPGDLLFLEAGDIVAADAQIVDSSHLQMNEAVLTGESLPVAKEVGETGKLFMGTAVVTGTAAAEVHATGMKTELGKIAHLISSAESQPTPLQIQLAHVGKALLWISLVVVFLVAVLGIVDGRPWMEVLTFSLSLAVAAVPEGMPAIVTVALALGVQRLANRNALIRKLPSVETLGSVSVICTDKTGTLTTGNMRVREIWGKDHAEVLRAAASCCDAELEPVGSAGTGDPTELAILIEARERGMEKAEIEAKNPRISTEPFDTERRMMSVFRADHVNYVKGAVESLISRCELDKETVDLITRTVDDMSIRGLRVIAVATGKDPQEDKLTLLGLLGIADPPRTESRQAIAEARTAGITPVMITGDHPGTAESIARELGLILEGEPLTDRVHARATPEDKLLLVRKWKSLGSIVAMTGDGVNDAPALREAHIGIAMGKTGTEVTRQSADLILADDNFATIVTAVREGRSIYQNIRKALTYLLSGNFAEILLVFMAILVGLPLPLQAAHLLWINLVTDALPALTLITEPVSPDLMKSPPRSPLERIMGWSQWKTVMLIGALESSIMLGFYYYLLQEYPISQTRGFLFTTFVLSQIFRSFGARSATRVFWELGAFSNIWLLGVAILTGVTQLSLHFFPLTQKIFDLKPLEWSDLLMILPVALVSITVMELKKLVQNFIRNFLAGKNVGKGA